MSLQLFISQFGLFFLHFFLWFLIIFLRIVRNKVRIVREKVVVTCIYLFIIFIWVWMWIDIIIQDDDHHAITCSTSSGFFLLWNSKDILNNTGNQTSLTSIAFLQVSSFGEERKSLVLNTLKRLDDDRMMISESTSSLGLIRGIAQFMCMKSDGCEIWICMCFEHLHRRTLVLKQNMQINPVLRSQTPQTRST